MMTQRGSVIDNILTVDLEDWRRIATRKFTGRTVVPGRELEEQTARMLSILSAARVRATFFIVGEVARFFPDLVNRIEEGGHEIALHSHDHRRLDGLTRDEFAADLDRGLEALAEAGITNVRGYRAPEFSITKRNLWALGVLVEKGFEYDSSIFPVRHRRYGIPGFGRDISRVPLEGGGSIVEVPLSTVRVLGVDLPASGGGYFRITPYFLFKEAVRRMNGEGRPVVLYIHPYELNEGHLNLDRPFSRLPGAAAKVLIQNFRLRSVPSRLEAILRDFRFVPIIEYLESSFGDDKGREEKIEDVA